MENLQLVSHYTPFILHFTSMKFHFTAFLFPRRGFEGNFDSIGDGCLPLP